MSARSASRSKKTPASSQQSSSSQSSRTPLSPTRLSRLQEKVELQGLNDRLAAYIDKVRQLESENNRLQLQITTTNDCVTREVTSVRNSYEKELADTRILLDETAKEKARLQLEAGKTKSELGEMIPKLNKTKQDLALAEKKIVQLETRNNDLNATVHQLKADLARALADANEAIMEKDAMAKQVPELQQQLESELLARTDLENRNMTLREELAFKAQMYEREMTEVRQSKQVEISEIDGRLQEDYQAKLQQQLQELREHYENQMMQNRDEVQDIYEAKVNNLESQLAAARSTTNAHYDELLQARTKLDGYNSKLSELESANAYLKTRIGELEDGLNKERNSHAAAMGTCQGEINRLRDEMATQLREYQDLMDIRTALDMEIAAYRKLLESEEDRLKLTPGSASRRGFTPGRSTPTGRAAKRKRTMLEESSSYSLSEIVTTSSAVGDMEVSEVEAEGKFIRLTNKGDKEVSLSGWQLVHRANDSETVYKFHRTLKAAPGATVTVWSAGAETAHDPPTDLVMKEQRWLVASEMATTLVSGTGDEMAKRESKREHTGTVVTGREELHHQQGDPEGNKCAIM